MKRLLTFYIVLLTLLLPVAQATTVSNTQNNNLVIPSVVMRAQKPSQPQSQLQQFTSSHVTVITAQQIKHSGATDVSQVLNGLAGVQLYELNGDNDQATIGMRGFGENAAANTLIMVNGQRLSNPDMSAPDLSTINLKDVTQIEVLPASAGVLYGDQAVGGVINIVTRQPEKLTANATASYGSYNQASGYASVSDRFKNGLNYQLSGQVRHNDNYRDHNRLNADNLAARIGYEYATGQVYFQYQYIKHNLDLPGALTIQQVDQDRQQVSPFSRDDFMDTDTNNYFLGFRQNLGDYWRLTGELSQRNVHGDSEMSGFPSSQRRAVTLFTPRLVGVIPVANRNIAVTAGSDLENDHYEFDTSATGDSVNDHRRMGGLYGQVNVPIITNLHATLGGRGALDYTRLNGQGIRNSALISEQGLAWQALPTTKLFVRRSGSFRFPKADEQNNFFTGSVTPLKTQTGVSYETGANFSNRLVNFNANIYQIDLDNEIAFAPPDNGEPRATNRNLDPTRRRGILLDGVYHVTSHWQVNADYSYVDGKFSSGPNAGKRIPLVARNSARVATGYHFFSHWYAYVEAIVNGNHYGSGDDSNQGRLLGGYTVYNANLAYQYRGWRFSGRMNNITGKQYYAYYIFPNAYYPAPERNFLLTLSYDFT